MTRNNVLCSIEAAVIVVAAHGTPKEVSSDLYRRSFQSLGTPKFSNSQISS